MRCPAWVLGTKRVVRMCLEYKMYFEIFLKKILPAFYLINCSFYLLSFTCNCDIFALELLVSVLLLLWLVICLFDIDLRRALHMLGKCPVLCLVC